MTVLQIAGILSPVSEVALALVTRKRHRAVEVRHRGSLVLLWVIIVAGIFMGIILDNISVTRVPLPSSWLFLVSLLIILGGLAIRWTAIITLGRFFTTTVVVHSDHRIIRTGLYRKIRHPSYAGLFLAFFGLAPAYGNWLSLIGILVPITGAVLYRIHVEESAMIEELGQEYADYHGPSKRLIPGVY